MWELLRASFMRVLSVRHSLKIFIQTALPWSIKLHLMCGEFNQGYNGCGAPMTKWGEDAGLLPAICMQ